MKISPRDGGCWFCYEDDDQPMELSREYDAYFHMDCLMRALTPGNVTEEAEIIAAEFGIE